MKNAKKILIVEDEKMLAEMYKDKFAQEGYEIYSAFDAEEAIEMAKEVKPDIVILDILLPRGNGIEFLRNLRNEKEIESTLVVAFSNYDDLETKKEAKELGAKDYLIKTNYTPKEVLAKVNQYLND